MTPTERAQITATILSGLLGSGDYTYINREHRRQENLAARTLRRRRIADLLAQRERVNARLAQITKAT